MTDSPSLSPGHRSPFGRELLRVLFRPFSAFLSRAFFLSILLCSWLPSLGASQFFDLNGATAGSGVVSGSYPWSGPTWSNSSAGTASTGNLPTRSTVTFSAGVDAFGTSLTLTGSSGEMGGVIVKNGHVTIQTLTRIFINGSVLQTHPGTSLTIQNSPDFYNNTVTLDTAADTTLTLAGASSGVRNAKFVKTGPGLVRFLGPNTGSSGGTLTINQGEFRIQSSSAVADGAAVVNSGGTLSLANNIAPARALRLHGPGHDGLGALRSVSGANSWNGLLTLGSAATLAADAGASLTLAPASGDALTGAHALTFGGAGNITVNRPITSVTSLQVTGSGTVTLSAANPFTGPTTVSSGQLRFAESSGVLASVGGPVAVSAGAEVVVQNTQPAAWSSPLSGSGRFVKQGAGALSLGGPHAFGGTVAIEAGALAVASASFSSPVRFEVASSATLTGPVALASGQTLSGAGSVSGALTLGGGAVLDFSTARPLTIAGPVSWSGTNTVRVPSSLPVGTHVLLRATGGGTLSGSLPALTLAGFIPGSTVASLQLQAGATELVLVVSNNTYAARTLVWAGDGTLNRWESGGSTPWRAAGLPVSFTATDHVVFDQSGASRPVVQLAGALTPGSVTISGSADYTLVGTGFIQGPAALAKSGAGRLIIETANSFTGGTVITAGTLELRAPSALGSGGVANSGALVFAPAAPFAFANAISGSGSLSLLQGQLTLPAANSFTGPVTVSSGTLTLGHASALGSTGGGTTVSAQGVLDLGGTSLGAEPLTLAGGVLRNSINPAAFAGPVQITSPSTLTALAPLTLSGQLGGGSSLTLTAGTLAYDGISPATASTLMVAAPATLAGAGTLGGPLVVEGTLAPSALATTPRTFTVRGAVSLSENSRLQLRLHKASGVPQADRLVALGPLTLNGRLTVFLSGEPLADGDTFQLYNAGSVSGSFASLDLPRLYSDLIWDRSELYSSGLLRVQRLPGVSSLAQRREWLLSEAANSPASYDGFIMAAAWFAVGEINAGRTLALSRSRSLVSKIRSSPVQIDLFDLWPAADLVLRYGSHLDAETLANIRESLTIFTQYKDTNTSNLKTLAWVTRYLGGQAFGEAAFSELNIANYWRVSDPNAGTQINNELANMARTGFGEHASRPYYWKNLLPMLSIAQLSSDPALRNRAGLAYEAGLAQNAHSWLRGHLGVATTRSYPDVLAQRPITSLGMLWYHFGGDVFPRNNETALFTAVMNQPVSPLLELAASDRSTPFASRAFLTGSHQTGWVNRDYILFSDGPRSVGNFQVYPNGVVWTEPNGSRNSFLWVAKPWRDDSGINVSNPHGRNTAQYKETQARDAALYIYDIPANDPLPYALSYIPGGYRALLNEAASAGNIFLHYGSVLIAIRSEVLFTWDPAGGVGFSSEAPRAGDSEFRINGTRFAVALETAHPTEFPGATPAEQLAAFRTAVLARSGPVSTAATPPFATYTSRRGDVLRVARSSDPATRPISLNGLPLNHNTWPVLESPWSFQTATGPLLLRSTARREVIDFSTWTRSVQLAPQLDLPATAPALAPGATLDLDLSAYATPATPGPLAFTLGPVSGGSATLLPDGRTVRFTAGLSPGPASLDFTAHAPGADPSQLVFLYDYETNFLSSNWVADTSGNRLSGTVFAVSGGTAEHISAVPPTLATHSTSSLQFNGTASTAVRVSRNLALSEQDFADADWTFATWARRDSTTSHDFILYLGSGDGFGGTGDELQLFFAQSSNTVHLQHYSAANVLDVELISPSTATPGVWHHLAVTFTRTALSTGVFRLYLNGSLVGTSSAVTWTPVISSTHPLRLGGCHATTSTAIPRFLHGALDDTALFRRALAPAEIARLATQSVSTFTGLAATGSLPLRVLSAQEQWRQTHFGTTASTGPAADLADPDADGVPNLLEYALGSHPASPASAAKPDVRITNISGPRLELSFLRARADLTYVVEASSTLAPGSWTVIATNPGTVGQSVTVTDSVSINPRRFLRLRVTPP